MVAVQARHVCFKNKHGILQLLQWLVIWGCKETLLVQSNMF
jgi:hypothetical protein